MEKSFKNLAALLCCLSAHAIYAGDGIGTEGKNHTELYRKVFSKHPDSLSKSITTIKTHGQSGTKPVIAGEHPDSLSKVVAPDWTKAPNSYIFDPSQDSDGLYIPVRKAYAMWQQDRYMGGTTIPNGRLTADVLWEDVHGLIRSTSSYALEVVDSGQNAKIKVPINKTKKGNAVVAFRVNGDIYWSWHIWVTDDPTNGPDYKSFEGVKRQRNDGTIELIPDSDWGWMDRNLGAITNTITQNEWNRNGGLLYQWGRKDPIPTLVLKGDDFYEVSGSIGRVRHRGAKNFTGAINFDNLRKYVTLSNSTITNNLRLAVRNPMSPIYVNKDDNSGPAYYNNNTALAVNWFGRSASLNDAQLSELNLWSDNSRGRIATNYNSDSSARPYQDKSSYDPCPNGWRIPSVLVANLASQAYVDDIRIDFSPYGVRTNMGKSTFEANKYHIIKPTDTNTPDFMKGFKIYTNTGFDLSSVGGFNMGLFPGVGQIGNGGQYSDQHHIGLWTATMVRHFDATPAISSRLLFMLPDKGQPDVPDPSMPDVKGRYYYLPLSGEATSSANGCRCIKDPLYVVDDYDFPTQYLAPQTEYREGIDNPNTYQAVKSTSAFTIDIPVTKAFSVQSKLLNNESILDAANYDDLKANILWTTNTGLINNVTVVNPSPGTLNEISSSRISVTVNPSQSGNAVITLHNRNTANPVYWSWHIWITDTAIGTYNYTTELPVTSVTNYVNYVPKANTVLQTEFMDRNLGATDTFPVVGNPLAPSNAELARIKASTGLHYQWGRKDPLPIFQYADDRTAYPVYLGNVTPSGTSVYTTLTGSAYNNLSGSYIVPYNTYTNAANANITATDKVSDRIAKVLSYSVRNPLVYMIPSTFAPYNSSNPLYTNGTDWLANEPNLAPDRWGRGGKKSPFDPCPQGWRIPDVTSVSITVNQDFGVTPWYKKDKFVATSYSIISDYLGTRVRRSAAASSTIGYIFNDSSYRIGNYPNSGSRGFRSVTTNQTSSGTFNFINYQYPGVWTAALNTNYIGRPINVLFDAASTANRMVAFHDNNDPYFGMSCRCVKIKYDEEGNEEGVIPRLQITSLPVTRPAAVLTEKTVQVAAREKTTFFPNPVISELYVRTPDQKDGYYYQVYNMSGQLVKTGKFENGKTDLSALISGIYLLRINDSKEMVKIIKQ